MCDGGGRPVQATGTAITVGYEKVALNGPNTAIPWIAYHRYNTGVWLKFVPVSLWLARLRLPRNDRSSEEAQRLGLEGDGRVGVLGWRLKLSGQPVAVANVIDEHL
jgi:hypothetical protein